MITHFHQILLGGLIGVFIVSSFADSLLNRGKRVLDASTLDGIARRQNASSIFWRIGQSVAFVLIALGVLRTWGSFPWLHFVTRPYSTVAVGMGLYCLTNSVRAWYSVGVYRAEAPDTVASRNAFFAAILITIAEAALGGGICWYVFTHSTMPASAAIVFNYFAFSS